MGDWGVTAQQVLDDTGATVTASQILIASAVCEIYINRSPSVSGSIQARDLKNVYDAIKWQAAWMIDQPGFNARQNVNRIVQDGVSVDYSPASAQSGREYAVTLSPLAARAIRNLSWKGSRSLQLQQARIALGTRLVFTNEASDDYTSWEVQS